MAIDCSKLIGFEHRITFNYFTVGAKGFSVMSLVLMQTKQIPAFPLADIQTKHEFANQKARVQMQM